MKILKAFACISRLAKVAATVALVALYTASSAAFAEAYPSKPIRLVVPFPPAGAADNIGRLLGQRITNGLGEPVIVDNRPGASGVLGATVVAGSSPDGYTLLIGAGGSLAQNIQMIPKPPYDPIMAFAPITMLTINEGILVVHPDFPARTLKEFIDLLKKSPGKYAYATAGPGGPGFFNAELLKSVAGIDMLHVPYRGDGPAIIDVLSGTVPIISTNLPPVAQHIRSGSLRAIASMGAKRFQTLPNLPTIAESGYPRFSAEAWLALLAPAGTAPEVVGKLNEVWRKAIADPEFNAKLVSLGSTPMASSPGELSAYIRDEHKKWGEIIRKIPPS
jgi:tripartite-type tricarboxylate transporter receptor subunit TctC